MSLKPIHWYNILVDLPEPMAPSLNPQTHEPVGPEDLAGIFPMELIKQEVSHQRDIEIPEEVQQYYRQWRTPWTSCPLCKLLLQPGYIGCHARSETA